MLWCDPHYSSPTYNHKVATIEGVTWNLPIHDHPQKNTPSNKVDRFLCNSKWYNLVQHFFFSNGFVHRYFKRCIWNIGVHISIAMSKNWRGCPSLYDLEAFDFRYITQLLSCVPWYQVSHELVLLWLWDSSFMGSTHTVNNELFNKHL